ncbi:MAG TPA: Nramp family divalent metal transporter [Gaiellaceae bacterium]|nr:Nramp family divalent metal transporter [Gaiellaceae bacterium]
MDASELAAARQSVLRGGRLRIWPYLGPAFIACVAYIDPGNFATNIAGGSKFGYTLVWVIVASNLMAMLIQTLSAKLGLATGRNLPEICRERLPRRATLGLWAQAEVIAMATDLAEFLGAALGIKLLLGIPLFPAAVLTGVVTFAILGLQRYGFRPFEAVIAAFVLVIGVSYLAELWLAHPPLGRVARHAVVPDFAGSESVLLAVGILGATVMPHVIYLHSALTQNRFVPRDEAEARTLYRYTRVDVLLAMTLAGLINISMLVIAATVFFGKGFTHVESLEGAHRTLQPVLGGASSVLFALALTASGLSSSTVGTLSGQVVMQGFLRRRIPLFVRRFVTMLPAFVVIGIGLDPSRTLVISQVVLSFGIPFALIPLVVFTSRREVMGVLVNAKPTVAAAAAVVTLISALNVFLLAQAFGLMG